MPPSQSMGPPPSSGAPSSQSAGRDTGFIAGTPRGATQELFDATNAAPSRYDVTPTQTSASQDSLPPPGWGPKRSTTSWSIATGRASTPVIPPSKMKRQTSATKFLKEIQGYLKALAILVVGAVVLFVFLQSRANTAEFHITILSSQEGSITGTLVIRDASGAELGRKQISESAARCPAYRRADISFRAKKSSSYVFEWNEVPSNSLTDAELSSQKYALVLDVRQAAYAEAGPTPQVC